MHARLQSVSIALERRPGTARLVGVKEAMRYGRWSRKKIYRLIADETIAAYKDGRTTLVDLDTVDDYQKTLPRFAPRKRG
jgi:excisionase family DNA binding protein